jgi:hypothetical protein
MWVAWERPTAKAEPARRREGRGSIVGEQSRAERGKRETRARAGEKRASVFDKEPGVGGRETKDADVPGRGSQQVPQAPRA